MNNTKLLAEKILMNAAKDNGGHCYPSQIIANPIEINAALEMLEMYGVSSPQNARFGPMPIFTINELGRVFASTGAWTGKEREEKIATERHREQMAAQHKNNKLVKWSIIITTIFGLATLLLSCFNNKQWG